MIGKAKAFSLALAAAAALSALATSAAQAGSLIVSDQPAVITGHSEPGQEQALTIQSTDKKSQLSLNCNTASFEGTTTGVNVNEMTVTPTFGQGKGSPEEEQGCTVKGQKAQVTMNGCKYTFTGAGQASKTFLVDIVGCTVGKQVEIVSTAGCNLKFAEQGGLSHAVIKQISQQEVTLEMKLTGFKVLQPGGPACPDGFHFGTNSTLTGNTVIKVFKDTGTSQVTKHNHQYTEHLCGTQLLIFAA